MDFSAWTTEKLLFHIVAQYSAALCNVQMHLHCKMSKCVMQSDNWAMWANMVSINMCWHISDVLRCLAENEKQSNIIRPSPALQEGPNNRNILTELNQQFVTIKKITILLQIPISPQTVTQFCLWPDWQCTWIESNSEFTILWVCYSLDCIIVQ